MSGRQDGRAGKTEKKTSALLLCALLLASTAHAGPFFEDARAGAAFAPPDGWTEIPTPPIPEDEERTDDDVTPLARFESDSAGTDGAIARFDVFLIRADSATEAREALSSAASDMWAEFKVVDTDDVAGSAGFHATLQGGRAIGAVVASGKRFSGLLLVGGAGVEEALLSRVAGTFAWSEPNSTAPLRVPPGWKAHDTTHYRLRYSGDEDFAREVGRHLEAISAELRRVLPLETPGADRRAMDVRLFRNAKEFEAYAAINGVRGAEAYFSPAQNELVAHMDERSPERTFHVLYHEATHQYLRDILGKNAHVPIWLDEGLAEIFYPGTFSRAGFTLPRNEDRRAEARDVFADGRAPSLEKLMSMSRSDFYTFKGAYGLGWSVTHFLLNDPRHRGVVVAALETLRDTKDPKKLQARLLENSSMEALEGEWKRWLTEE